MQHSKYLWEAIKYLGSRRKLATSLGISPQRLNGWLNNYRNMGVEHALLIEGLTEGRIKALHLLPDKFNYLEKRNYSVRIYTHEISYKKIALSLIRNTHLTADSATILNDNSDSIIVDENFYLIAGECVLKKEIFNNPSSVFAYVLPLEKLMNGQLLVSELIEKFTLSERIFIGIAWEKRIKDAGKRRSTRGSPPNRYRASALPLRTIIAKQLGFGNHTTYEGLKKSLKTASPLLINALNKKQLSIHAVIKLASLPTEEQLKQINFKLQYEENPHE